jgi:hypothetical protein
MSEIILHYIILSLSIVNTYVQVQHIFIILSARLVTHSSSSVKQPKLELWNRHQISFK